jgi:hypothetical protein
MANENDKPGQQGGTNTPGQQTQQPGQSGQQGDQEKKNPGQNQQGDTRK